MLSNFTLAYFEDSGWYKVNYSSLEGLNQLDLLWGKGEFLARLECNHRAINLVCQCKQLSVVVCYMCHQLHGLHHHYTTPLAVGMDR